MPLRRLNETLGKKRAAHLLRRTCFGGTRQEIDDLASMTPAQALNVLFDDDVPDPPHYPLHPTSGENWAINGLNSNTYSGPISDLSRHTLAIHLGNMLGHGVANRRKLPFIFRERLTYFLHTHFTTNWVRILQRPRLLYYQIELFRLFAFDKDEINREGGPYPRNFKQLVKKISLDNAMLIYLNGRENQKGNPNENYARELMELYAIGRGLEGSVPETGVQGDYYYYTEEDVVAGAKVLTGYTIDEEMETIDEETGLPIVTIRSGSGSRNIATRHEDGVKRFSERLGSARVRPNPDLMTDGNHTRESMIDELSQYVDIIFDQEETARHICRKLYRFFVYHHIDEDLQEDIIEDMADTFRNNDFKMQPVLERLLTSEHFYNRGSGVEGYNYGSLIKSPLDLSIGFLRSFEVDIPNFNTRREDYYQMMRHLLGQDINGQGHEFYQPSMVAGYPAYHQFPTYSKNWINSTFLTQRYKFVEDAISSNPDRIRTGQVDILSFVENNFSDVASNPRELIIAIAEYFLPLSENISFERSNTGELSAARIQYFLDIFLYENKDETDPETVWTNNWNNGRNRSEMARQLEDLFNAMFQSPEYQLM